MAPVAAACAALAAFVMAGTGEDPLERSVAAMARIGSTRSPSFSPDGRTLAMVSDMAGVPQVWTVPVAGGWPTQVTALEDPVGGVAWSPAGDWLALSVAPGGGMNSQVFVMRPDGTGLRRLTPGGKDNNWLSGWTHDGRSLVVASNRDDPGAMSPYLVDPAAGTMRLAARNRGIGSLTDVSRDGKRAVLYRMRSRGDDDLFLVSLSATGPSTDEVLLTRHEPPGQFEGGLFSPDGRTIYLASNKDRDLMAFARVRLDAQGKPGPIEVIAARDDAELEEVTLADDGSVAALLWNASGSSELAFVDLKTGRMQPAPPAPAEIVSEMTFSRDARLLAFSASGAAAPTDVWVLDRGTGKYRQISRSPHAGVELDSLVRPELVRFAAHDGVTLTGWLYRPRLSAGSAPSGPMVLSFHGGPEGQERPRFSSTYQALLSRGIAVLAPNVRGSSGFGKKFMNLDNGALRADGVRDIEACVAFAVKSGNADPKRLGIMGGSYGGYMVMAGLTRYPDMFAAGANLFGVVNFETFFAHTEPWMAAISTVEYGDPNTQAALLRELSPIHAIDRVKAPTIVLHGANDTNVPVVEAEQVVENLKRRGVPVEYVLFPDEGHGWRKMPNRVRSATAIVGWFETHLKPGETGDEMGAIAEDYVRLVLAVGQHDADYVDAYYGPPAWKAEAEAEKAPLAELKRRAQDLLDRVKATAPAGDEPSALRYTFLTKQLQSLSARLRMLEGEKLSFDEESRALYDTVAPRRTEERFQATIARLDALLPGEGPTADRYQRWREGFVIPADRLDGVFRAAVKACQDRTRRHIDLPPEESFTIEYVKDKPWSGYNWYQGSLKSLIQINVSLPIFADRALDLACHEGYPGHHVYNMMLEQQLVRGRGWMEFTVYPLFSPMSLIAEGSANHGIDMAFPGAERAKFEREVVFPLAGLDPARVEQFDAVQDVIHELDHAGNEAARRYLDGAIDAAEASRWLQRYALMSKASADQRVRFIDRYRSYVINYNVGRELVASYVERRAGPGAGEAKRWEVFKELLASPRLPSGLL